MEAQLNMLNLGKKNSNKKNTPVEFQTLCAWCFQGRRPAVYQHLCQVTAGFFDLILCVCAHVHACVFAASFINAAASLNQFLHRGRRHAGYRASTLSRSVLGDGGSITSSPKNLCRLFVIFSLQKCHADTFFLFVYLF